MNYRQLTIGLGTLLLVVSCSLFFAPKAQAATIPLSGYAWSETIGWVHFQSSGSPAYGVLVDSSSGAMSGYAWSENLGWLSFNGSETGSCGSAANLNIQSGVMDGWAKWLSSGECVHLKGSNYGVTYNSNNNEFSGYAWGETDTGWMHWKGSGYGVVSGSPIVAPPAAPTSLTASTTSTTQINLAWVDNASGETGFIIERKIGTGGTYAQIATANPNAQSYQNTGLAAGTLYYYRVKATNNGGDSAYSNEASATTLYVTSTINVTASPASATWTINPGSLAGTGTGSKIVTPSQTGTSYTLTGGAAPSGYDSPPTITNTQGSGSMVTLFGGETVGFTLTYNQSIVFTCCTESGGGGGGGSSGSGNPADLTITKGVVPPPGSTQVFKTLISGTTKPVSIDVSGQPAGVTVEYVNRDCSPTCTTTLLFRAYPAAPATIYLMTVTATPEGGSPQTTHFNLTIINSPDLTISCSHLPASAPLGQEVTWTANVTSGGAGGPYEYSWTGTNVPSSLGQRSANNQSFAIVYSTTGSKSAQATVYDKNSNPGICPSSNINIGVSPIFQEF